MICPICKRELNALDELALGHPCSGSGPQDEKEKEEEKDD